MEKGETLNFVQKREIVQRLARFETPTEVQKAFKADYGLTLSLPRILYYDPTGKQGAALSDELKALFQEEREKAKTHLDGIRIYHKAAQLRALDKALTLAESRGAVPIVISVIEAAAKIAGTIVSKHEHTGKDGKELPAPVATVTIIQLPDNGRN
jgi:hypothetical protein